MAVLALDEAKSHLRITGTDDDGKLQDFIDAAVAAIGERVGPLEPVAKTVRASPVGRGLRVPTPAISLTSVVDADGTALTIGDLYLHPSTGLLSYNDGTAATSRYYTVTYMAGRDPVPPDLVQAVKELVHHFWVNSQRGPTRRPGSSASESAANTVPGAAYLLPFRVSELIKPHIPLLVGI